ncbi:MAG: pyridoxamine 5'-phosphate oxidase family protein [Sphingobacteriaceae bacterium]
MFGDLNEKQIENLLKSQVIGRIGCHAEGLTYIVPFSYLHEDDYVYGHTHEGLKVQIMRKNPKVCFEVDVMLNMANWQSVIAWGEYDEITEESEIRIIKEKLAARIMPFTSNETSKPASGLFTDEISAKGTKEVIFKIKLINKTGKFEKR